MTDKLMVIIIANITYDFTNLCITLWISNRE